MNDISTGHAWIFGDRVTTDDILPGKYLDRANDEAGQFAMSGIDPDFAANVTPGDFIVAGDRFGSGSGRENAVAAILGAGIGAVIATSFSRLFTRNAVNLGLAPVIVDSVADIAPGDLLKLDLAARHVTIVDRGIVLPVRNLTGTVREILDAGGIVAYTRAHLAAQR